MSKTIHDKQHPQARESVVLKDGSVFTIQDWWDRFAEKSLAEAYAQGDPAAVLYMAQGIPPPPNTKMAKENPEKFQRLRAQREEQKDEIVYGHIGNLGKIVHVSDITEDEEVEGDPFTVTLKNAYFASQKFTVPLFAATEDDARVKALKAVSSTYTEVDQDDLEITEIKEGF